MSTSMAAVATNGTHSSQMRGKRSAGTKALKSFSEELASAREAGSFSSQEVSTLEITPCLKPMRRSRTRDVTNSGQSVRGKSREDRREEVAKQRDESATPNTDRAPVLEPTAPPLPAARERDLHHALVTETVPPEGARSFATKVVAVARGNGHSSIALPRVTSSVTSAEEGAIKQLRAEALAQNRVASEGEEHRRLGANAASANAVPELSGESGAQAGMPEANGGVVSMERSESINSANAPIEKESIRLVASFDAKDVPSIPVVDFNSRVSTQTIPLGDLVKARQSDPNSDLPVSPTLRDGIVSGRKSDSRGEKGASSRSESPVVAPLNAVSVVSVKAMDQPHSQFVGHLQTPISNQKSKRNQDVQQIPNGDRAVVKSNAPVHWAMPEVSRTAGANAAKDTQAEARTIKAVSDGQYEGLRSTAFKSEHNARRQQSNSIASETSVGAMDGQSQFANTSDDKTADASVRSVPAFAVPASVTQMSTASSPETSLRATKLDAAAQLERTRQLAAAQSFLQTAKLTDRGGRTELHVGLTAGELGNVSIRTFMVHDQVKAEISVQKEELRNLLEVGLSEIQSKISKTADTTPNIVFSAGANPGQGSNGSAHTYQHQQGSLQHSGSNAVRGEVVDGAIAPSLEVSSTSAKLDIRM